MQFLGSVCSQRCTTTVTRVSRFPSPQKDSHASTGLSLARGARCPALVPSAAERAWGAGVPSHLPLLAAHPGGCARCCRGRLRGRVPPFILGLHTGAWLPSHEVSGALCVPTPSPSLPSPFPEASGAANWAFPGPPAETLSSGKPSSSTGHPAPGSARPLWGGDPVGRATHQDLLVRCQLHLWWEQLVFRFRRKKSFCQLTR